MDVETRVHATPWTVACQTSLSTGFSRQGYWSGLPFPLRGDFPDPGIESVSPAAPALRIYSLLQSHQEAWNHGYGGPNVKL